MQNKLVSKIFAVAAPTAVVFGALALMTPAAPQSVAQHSNKFPPPPRCSAKTLSGDYAFTIEGALLSIPNVQLPPGVSLPLHGIALSHYDGKGNRTQVDHVVVNGEEPSMEWTPGSGTYTVNDDCTGSQELFITGNPLSPIRSHFVIDKNGREIREVVDANAVSAIGTKVEY
ncbi:MAG TPA: hypothetical protein VGJ06_04850 [Candidatus Acidoferrum sp.]|jgi:hypothetical protein